MSEKKPLWHLLFFQGGFDGKKVKIHRISERIEDYEKCTGSFEAWNRTPCLAEADFPTELYGLDFKLFVVNFFLCHFGLHLHLISYLNP